MTSKGNTGPWTDFCTVEGKITKATIGSVDKIRQNLKNRLIQYFH